jgi:hypothetical protein
MANEPLNVKGDTEKKKRPWLFCLDLYKMEFISSTWRPVTIFLVLYYIILIAYLYAMKVRCEAEDPKEV